MNNEKRDWRDVLAQEFKIHFKDSLGEFEFLIAFVEDVIEEQKKEIGRKIIELLRGL